MIYPVDSAIQRLNNWSQVFNDVNTQGCEEEAIITNFFFPPFSKCSFSSDVFVVVAVVAANNNCLIIGSFSINDQAPVVQKVDNAIHQINHYPLDIAIGFATTYPVDSDLSGG